MNRLGYVILHKPTGLYFRPSRTVLNLSGKRVKSHLSKKGKVYGMYPSLKWIGKTIYTHLHDESKNVSINTNEDDWEIQELGTNKTTKDDRTKIHTMAFVLRRIATGETYSSEEILDMLEDFDL